MSKTNTKETKLKQIKSIIPKLLKTLKYERILTNYGPQMSFVETMTRKLEFEKWAKIPNRGQNVIL